MSREGAQDSTRGIRRRLGRPQSPGGAPWLPRSSGRRRITSRAVVRVRSNTSATSRLPSSAPRGKVSDAGTLMQRRRTSKGASQVEGGTTRGRSVGECPPCNHDYMCGDASRTLYLDLPLTLLLFCEQSSCAWPSEQT